MNLASAIQIIVTNKTPPAIAEQSGQGQIFSSCQMGSKVFEEAVVKAGELYNEKQYEDAVIM